MTKTFYSSRSDMYHYAASADYNGERIRSANSTVEGNKVWSYATVVAMFDKKKEILLYTGHHYSMTTSNSLWELRRAFDHYKRRIVYDFTVEEGYERLVEMVKEHVKEPATRKDDKQFFIECVESLQSLVEFFGKGKRYLNSHTMHTAQNIVSNYQQQIEEKERRRAEREEKRRKEEEQKRLEAIERTENICREYDPNFDAQPKTFRECVGKGEFVIPMSWFQEHHPEVLEEVQDCPNKPITLFRRGWNYVEHRPTNTLMYNMDKENFILLRPISRYSANYKERPDILLYDYETKILTTSQRCTVDDRAGHVKTLLGLFLKAVDEGKDVSFVIGKHCGPYEIRGYNAAEKFLRVGCHCFLLENLREVYNDMKGE